MALQNQMRAVIRQTRIWWNLGVIFSLISPVVCQSQILIQRMSPSLKTGVWQKRAENTVLAKNGCTNLTGLRDANSMNCRFCSRYLQHNTLVKHSVSWADKICRDLCSNENATPLVVAFKRQEAVSQCAEEVELILKFNTAFIFLYTANCQIISGPFICFNHLTDQVFIWDQMAIWDRRLIPSLQKSCPAKLGKYCHLFKFFY